MSALDHAGAEMTRIAGTQFDRMAQASSRIGERHVLSRQR